MSDEVVQPGAETETAAETNEVKSFDEAYVRKLRDEAAGYRVKLKEIEDRDKSEAEKLSGRLAELERENSTFKHAAERAGWLRDAAKATGLPLDAIEVVGGDTYEDLLAGATRIKSLIPEQQTRIPAGAESTAIPLNGDGIEDALRKALGV